MDFTSWTNNMIAALIQIRGEGAPSPTGHRLPSITALDTIPIIGRYAPALATSIERLQSHHNNGPLGDIPTGAINKRSVDADGSIGGEGGMQMASDLANRISIAKYLGGYGVQPITYNRRMSSMSNAAQYTFYIGGAGAIQETALVNMHRQAVREWQRAIDASVSAILANSTDLTRKISPTDNAAFWAAIRSLASSLAAIAANPPEDVFDRIKSATNAALDESAEVVGKSAAQIANKVGELAGKTAEGFFAEAGMTSILVAGLAVALAIR